MRSDVKITFKFMFSSLLISNYLWQEGYVLASVDLSVKKMKE